VPRAACSRKLRGARDEQRAGAAISAGLKRLRKNPSHRHPEEAKPVLSETKEGPLYLLENSNTGVLRFAQDDSIGAFFRSLFNPAATS
jgi:hypothetical protein